MEEHASAASAPEPPARGRSMAQRYPDGEWFENGLIRGATLETAYFARSSG
jgi:hypothetical protein